MLDSELYDFAFSFAGEHRAYVEATKNACEILGLKVFYDRDKNNEWWGRNFIVQQRKVYGAQARYFVPFISVEYLAKPIPADEYQAAMLTAVERGDDYILPVLIGDVQVPSELLHPHTHYLRADDYSPDQLAREMQRRLGRPGTQQPGRDIAEVVSDAVGLRMPKVVPQTFSKYQELKVVFDYLADRFETALPQLGQLGFVGTLDKLERTLSIRIERSGQTAYALDIRRGSSFGDDKLDFAVGQHHFSSNSSNGWATPYFDKDAGRPMLNMSDLSVLGPTGGDRKLSKEELFEALWNRIVDQLEA